ncbi:MAG: creatininase family protein [Bacteroidales bacterium]|nr:creatininase family protein [Bacteroidales bacterium]
MEPRPYVLAETNWKTTKDQEYEIAILPWGATEAHNFHLPYGIDNIQSDYIAIESAKIAWEKGVKSMVLPCVPFGVNTGQLDIKFCINMNPSTQHTVLIDVVDSLCVQGIKKILILNGHGGNDFKQSIREIQVDYPEIFLCTLDWWRIMDNEKYFSEPGDHAGEMETSNIMYINPDLALPVSEAGDGQTRNFKLKAIKEGWVWAQRKWTKISDDTGVGNPKQATREKGQKFLEAVTNKIAGFLVELNSVRLEDLYE